VGSGVLGKVEKTLESPGDGMVLTHTLQPARDLLSGFFSSLPSGVKANYLAERWGSLQEFLRNQALFPSASSSCFLRSSPQRYPAKSPLLRTTR
jgi:hypothetical protein